VCVCVCKEREDERIMGREKTLEPQTGDLCIYRKGKAGKTYIKKSSLKINYELRRNGFTTNAAAYSLQNGRVKSTVRGLGDRACPLFVCGGSSDEVRRGRELRRRVRSVVRRPRLRGGRSVRHDRRETREYYNNNHNNNI